MCSGLVSSMAFLSFKIFPSNSFVAPYCSSLTVPLSCVVHRTSFYQKLVVKTVGPALVLVLLWLKPLVDGKASSSQLVSKLSLLWLELIYTSVSTTIFETFACSMENFSTCGSSLLSPAIVPRFAKDGSFMRLSCSSFTALVRALSFACSLTTKQSINSRLFPTGAPLLFFVLTYYNRDALKQLLLTVHETDMHLDNHALRGSITIGQAARPLRGSITIGQAAHRPSLFARWPSSHVAFAAESIRLNWLVKKVERFVPSCW